MNSRVCINGMVIAALLLAGCNPMSKQSFQSSEKSEKMDFIEQLKNCAPSEVEEHINYKISDSMTIDADIEGIKGLKEYKLSSLNMKRHLFEDKDTDLDIIADEMSIEPTGQKTERKTDYYLEDGSEEISRAISGKNENDYLQVRDTYIIGSTEQNFNYNGLYISIEKEFAGTGDKNLEGNIDKLELDKDLDFMSVKDVKENLKTLIKKINIDMDYDVSVYSGTSEVLNEIKENEDFDSSQENMQFKDTYWVKFTQIYDTVPFIRIDENSAGSVTNTPKSISQKNKLVLTEDGIIEIEIDNIFDIESEQESKDIVPLGNILEKAAEHNKKTIRKDEKEKITHVELCYLPIHKDGKNLDFTGQPIWWVRSVVQQKEGIDVRYLAYDAFTGEEIPWEG